MTRIRISLNTKNHDQARFCYEIAYVPGTRGSMSEGRHLTENGLVLALGSVVSVEATTDSAGVIAKTSSGTVTSSFVSVTFQHIRTGWALN
jgi:hypothetical protein